MKKLLKFLRWFFLRQPIPAMTEFSQYGGFVTGHAARFKAAGCHFYLVCPTLPELEDAARTIVGRELNPVKAGAVVLMNPEEDAQ